MKVIQFMMNKNKFDNIFSVIMTIMIGQLV